MDARLKEATRAEWREFGFFYDRDDTSKEWLVKGSRGGLLQFANLLREYASDPRNATESEHEHYGPYMYLEIMTSPTAGMDDHSIHGRIPDLQGLATLVEEGVAKLDSGGQTRIGNEFADASAYSLILQLEGDDFDPASPDANLAEDAG